MCLYMQTMFTVLLQNTRSCQNLTTSRNQEFKRRGNGHFGRGNEFTAALTFVCNFRASIILGGVMIIARTYSKYTGITL
jgi:hypothetical protein